MGDDVAKIITRNHQLFGPSCQVLRRKRSSVSKPLFLDDSTVDHDKVRLLPQLQDCKVLLPIRLANASQGERAWSCRLLLLSYSSPLMMFGVWWCFGLPYGKPADIQPTWQPSREADYLLISNIMACIGEVSERMKGDKYMYCNRGKR